MSPPESGFDPSRTPPVPPPPGVISNFTDPDSLSATCLAINVSFLAIAGVFVILRFYTRACITRRVGWDDCTNYGIGRHAWDVPLTLLHPMGMKLFVWGVATYCAGILFIKMSLLALYHQSFALPPAWFRVQWWTVLVITVGYSISGICVSLFGCTPVAFAWDPTIPGGQCVDRTKFYIVQGWLNAITDLGLLALPLPIVWTMTLAVRQKIVVSVLFVVGSFTCIVSVYRVILILQDPVGKGVDFTRGIAWSGIWSNIEMSCAIVCTSAVTLRPLVRKHFSSLVPAQLRSNQVNLTTPHDVVYGSGGFGAPSHPRMTRVGSVELGARKKSENNDSQEEILAPKHDDITYMISERTRQASAPLFTTL